jgi:hypothetical protein
MMRSPALALAWQLYRPNRWGFYAIAAGLTVLAVLSRTLATHAAVQTLGGVSVILFVLTLLYVMSVFAYSELGPRGKHAGLPPRMLTLPMHTAALVAWPMLYGMIAAALLWLAAVWLVFEPCGMMKKGDIWWPALVCAALTANFQAVAWTFVGSPLVRLVVAVTLLPAWVVAAVRSGVIRDQYDLVPWLILLITGSYLLAVAGVMRDRRGAGSLLAWLRARAGRAADRLRRRRAPFASAARAQVWFEWRQKGLILPCLLGVFMLGLLLTVPVTAFDAPLLLRVLAAFVSLPLVAAFVVGFGMGKRSFWAKELGLTPYTATRPVSSGALALAKLQMAARSAAAAWALMLALAVLWVFLSGTRYEVGRWWERLSAGRQPLEMWSAVGLGLVGVVALTWGQLVGGLCLGLTGRPWVVNAVTGVYLAGAAGLGAVGVWTAYHPTAYDAVLVILWVQVVLALLAKLLVAAWAVRAVYRRGLLGAGTLGWLLAVWAVGTGSLVALNYLVIPAGPAPRHLIAAAQPLLLPLVRLMATPLALAWDRHR